MDLTSRKNSRAQASTEYMLVVVFMLAGVIGVTAYFYSTIVSDESNVNEAKLSQIGADIIDISEKLYQSPGFAKRTMDYEMPMNLLNITVDKRKSLSFRIDTNKGALDRTFESRVPIAVKIDPDYLAGGYLTLTRKEHHVLICSGTCECDQNESFSGVAACTDNIDNDCDGFLDCCDVDCTGIAGCPLTADSDNDLWPDACGDPVFEDCEVNDPFINQDANEICGDGIDNDCNGVVDC